MSQVTQPSLFTNVLSISLRILRPATPSFLFRFGKILISIPIITNYIIWEQIVPLTDGNSEQNFPKLHIWEQRVPFTDRNSEQNSPHLSLAKRASRREPTNWNGGWFWRFLKGQKPVFLKQSWNKNFAYIPCISLRTRICWLSLAGNSVICILFLDFVRFAIWEKCFIYSWELGTMIFLFYTSVNLLLLPCKKLVLAVIDTRRTVLLKYGNSQRDLKSVRATAWRKIQKTLKWNGSNLQNLVNFIALKGRKKWDKVLRNVYELLTSTVVPTTFLVLQNC